MLRLIALLLTFATSLPAWAQDRPRAGLMWNRSGLPATLPLVVKTTPGRDHVVFLGDDDNGDIMAGYIRGGDFFRLLVPPGDAMAFAQALRSLLEAPDRRRAMADAALAAGAGLPGWPQVADRASRVLSGI